MASRFRPADAVAQGGKAANVRAVRVWARQVLVNGIDPRHRSQKYHAISGLLPAIGECGSREGTKCLTEHDESGVLP